MHIDYLKTIITTIEQAGAYLIVNYFPDMLQTVECLCLIIMQ